MVLEYRMPFRTILAIASLLVTTCGAMAASGGSPRNVLDRLEPGEWELRPRDHEGARTRMCLANGQQLVQLRHPAQTCRNVIVEDTATAITITYTCPDKGYGRTHIRFENSRLVQLETQGIAKGLPFDFSAEARKSGPCPR